MIRNWRWTRRAAAAVLATTLFVVGCSDQSAPVGDLLGPQETSFNKGKGPIKKGVPIVVKGPLGGKSWTLLTGELPDSFVSVAEGVARARGNSGKVDGLTLAIPEVGYFINVPDNAVPAETRFKLRAVKRHAPNGGGSYLAVDLKATRVINGIEVDVGSLGFLKDVQLGMAYVWSGVSDPSGLQITWVVSKSDFREVECFAGSGKVCISEGNFRLKDGRNVGVILANLRHFSDYAIGFPN